MKQGLMLLAVVGLVCEGTHVRNILTCSFVADIAGPA